MITGIPRKGLKRYWTKGDRSKLPPTMVAKIERVLNIIDYLKRVPDDLEGFNYLRPHPLKGSLSAYWALDISGNFRIIFKFDNNSSSAFDLDLVDYH